MKTNEAVILIGHGAAASDTPKHLVEELKRLEMRRRAQKISQVSPREAELDKQVRQWPRTPESDPYKYGLESLAQRLATKLSGKRLAVAYNEFCAPSVEETIDILASEGVTYITLITTMFTRGGLHSEIEIPEIVAAARRRYPKLTFEYAWPFDLDHVCDFLASHLKQIVKT